MVSMSKCCVCGKDGPVEITFENPDGTKESEFYCISDGREEFKKEWERLKRC